MRGLSSVGVRLVERGVLETRSLAEIARTGMLAPQSPTRLARLAVTLKREGQLGAAITSAAVRHGGRPGLTDEHGTLTFAELDRRANALAAALAARGVRDGDCVGVLCRNGRAFYDASFAAGKLGVRLLLLNTDFAGPQLADVCDREGVTVLIHDAEYCERLESVTTERGRVIADPGGETAADEDLEALIALHEGERPPAAQSPGAVVLLTSGTTGTPKGAPRHTGMSLHPVGALLSKVPYRAGESTYVAAPMFHGLGLTQTILAVVLGSTVITERRFRAERVLDAIDRQRPTALVLVPVMLARMVTLLEEQPGRWDTSSLRIVFLSGSQLSGDLVRRAHRTIGEKLYNFYGTTEVAWATFATPEDLRAAPGCAGRPPFGTTLRLLDTDGRIVEGAERTGRIFVGNGFEFEGYTGGGQKEVVDGLMSTGDVGHFDADGRLWVDGRDDDMIVSGGENVFPGEVEELLATHPSIVEAAVIGAEDLDFGQRLVAYVVPAGEGSVDCESLQEFVAANLARYKVPREIHLVDELPRNPTGKILKRQLRERHKTDAI